MDKTVSITPHACWRIICRGWVNCDLRSVMTCNNFLSVCQLLKGRHVGNAWEKDVTKGQQKCLCAYCIIYIMYIM